MVFLLDYFADLLDYTIHIKPAAIGFGKSADFVQHISFAVVKVKCLEFDDALIVINATFFGVDDFQFLPSEVLV